MSAVQEQKMGWKVEATDPRMLTTEQWTSVSLLGVIFLVMAILQLISFADFRDSLSNMGLSGASTWAAVIIMAELWGAAGFFKIRLSHLFRVVSGSLAVLVSLFWFVENLQLISSGYVTDQSSGLFGRFLSQTPGWWTAIEVTILLFWTMYAVTLTIPAMAKRR